MTAVRPALPGDAARIAAIYNQGIEERQATFETAPRAAADVRDWLDPAGRRPILVAVEPTGVQGWARAAAYSERAAYAGVGEVSVYVDRAARGRGLGRTLLDALAREAEAAGCWKLVSKVMVGNAASAALVRRCGWREVGLHVRHARLDGRWRDVLVVERLLR